MDERQRRTLSKASQIAIYRRDGWLCYWCKQPVIFAPTMRLLELELRKSGFEGNIAYYHSGWSRAGAPLLDQLGATIDHKEASSTGGAGGTDNLATACWKCNVRKGAKNLEKWDARHKAAPVKGRYGEPQHWDGLSALFVMLAKRDPATLTPNEREWLRAMQSP
jgi:hypothetical protein